MSETKHTPGPWTLGKGEVTIREEEGERRFIARTHIAGDNRQFPQEEQHANAKLIAAAPDLLAACEAFVVAWDKSRQLEKTDAALSLARAAIAKAGAADCG